MVIILHDDWSVRSGENRSDQALKHFWRLCLSRYRLFCKVPRTLSKQGAIISNPAYFKLITWFLEIHVAERTNTYQ